MSLLPAFHTAKGIGFLLGACPASLTGTPTQSGPYNVRFTERKGRSTVAKIIPRRPIRKVTDF